VRSCRQKVPRSGRRECVALLPGSANINRLIVSNKNALNGAINTRQDPAGLPLLVRSVVAGGHAPNGPSESEVQSGGHRTIIPLLSKSACTTVPHSETQ